jgi:hypothetical protein
MREEAFYAYSLAMTYRKEIKEAWKEIDIMELAKIDYAELMK